MKVTIEDLNPDGRGRGRQGKKTILVSQALPGEEVTVRTDRTTRNTVQGRIRQLLTPNPDRLSGVCPHELRCTGCALLTAPTSTEDAFKLAKIHQALGAAGFAETPVETLRRPTDPFGYRHFAKLVFEARDGGVVLGGYVAGTHRVVGTGGCPVLAPAVRAITDTVAQRVQTLGIPIHGPERPGLRYALARGSRSKGDVILALVTSDEITEELQQLAENLEADNPQLKGVLGLHHDADDNRLTGDNVALLCGDDGVEEEILGFTHRVAPTRFFQINPAAAEVIFGRARELAGQGDVCIEGFAGSGALTLPLTKHFEHVIAIESVESAVNLARQAATLHGLESRVTLEHGDVAARLPGLLKRFRPEAAVMDPPRRGLGEGIARALAQSSIQRIVLVSCAPPALAVDLPALREAGFQLTAVAPVDQFPRTAHVEVVVGLERTRSPS